jgi:hypothetical protein
MLVMDSTKFSAIVFILLEKNEAPRQSLAEGPKFMIGGTTLISRHTPAHFGSLTPVTLRFAAELRAGFPQVPRKPLAACWLSLGRFPCVLLRIIADTYAQMIRFFAANVKRKSERGCIFRLQTLRKMQYTKENASGVCAKCKKGGQHGRLR